MKPKLKKIFNAAVVVLIVVGVCCLFVYREFMIPTGVLPGTMVFTVEKGDSLTEVARELKEHDLIKHERVFIGVVRIFGLEGRIRAGEYEITPDMSPKDILVLLLSGKVVEYTITIPEGYNVYQIAALLEERGLVDTDVFLAYVKDESFIESLDIDAPLLEGYLFPDTYHINRGMDEAAILKLFVQRFFEVFDEEMESVIAEGGSMTLDELGEYAVIILASIVEKEAGKAEERTLVSAVFVNRLEKGMKLDSCATVIYGIWDRFDGNLTRGDLEEKTDYNTYVIGGLPPTPICNPGREAIRAALGPADVDYLYFVSKNDGTHHFSSTLSEHNRAVYKYQKLRTYR
jgi:UPF0755 protein